MPPRGIILYLHEQEHPDIYLMYNDWKILIIMMMVTKYWCLEVATYECL